MSIPSKPLGMAFGVVIPGVRVTDVPIFGGNLRKDRHSDGFSGILMLAIDSSSNCLLLTSETQGFLLNGLLSLLGRQLQ